MKTFGKFLFMTALAAVFFSCSNDDNEGNLPKDPKPETINIFYSYENTAEFFQYVDVEITYLDGNGVEKKGELTDNAWKYETSVDYKSAPTNYACTIFLKRKNVELPTSSIKMKSLGSYRFHVNSTYDDGQNYPVGSPNIDKLSSEGNYKPEILSQIPAEGMTIPYTFTLDKSKK